MSLFDINVPKNKRNQRRKQRKRLQKQTNAPQKAVTVSLEKFEPNDRHRTHTSWTVFAHDKSDTDFSNESYVEICKISTLEDMWVFLKIPDFSHHQFYIMREGILPRYEDPANVNGGSVSFLIHSAKQVKSTFEQLLVRIMSENLVPKPFVRLVTGVFLNVYLAPKSGANVKIWFSDLNWLHRNLRQVNVDDIQMLQSKRISKHKLY